MMHSRFLVVLLMIALIVAGIIPNSKPVYADTNAQFDQNPVVLWSSGDYWRYFPSTGLSEQITTWGWNQFPVISPDGKSIAYKSTATVAVNVFSQGGGEGEYITIPNNIWVLDIATGDGFRPADQPAGASFSFAGSNNYIDRSTPVWSPDGTKLAWTELVIPSETLRLAIYTLASQTTEFFPLNLAPVFGFTIPRDIAWGNTGIAVQNLEAEQGTGNPYMHYYIYNANGTFIQKLGPISAGDQSVLDFGWITTPSGEQFGVSISTGFWNLYDVAGGGGASVYGGSMDVYNPLVPNGAFAQVSYQANTFAYAGTFVSSGGQKTVLPHGQSLLENYSVSPTANAVSYTDIQAPNGTYIFENNTERTVSLSGKSIFAAVWGPIRWRLSDASLIQPTGPTPLSSAPIVCPGFLPSRLNIGTTAHVLPGESNNMRAQANLNAALLTQIPGGSNITVVSGPVCSGNLAWWEVTFQAFTGWTAEGTGNVYWLQPGPSTSLMPNLSGAVLEITPSGSPTTAYTGVSKSTTVLETLLWGDRVLWQGKRVNNETFTWLEVILGSGQTAYVLDSSTAFTVRDGGYQTPNMASGKTVVVTGDGSGMHMRANTSTYSAELKTLAAGDTLSVVGGASYGEYFIWWRVRAADGTEGWVVDVPGWLQVK